MSVQGLRALLLYAGATVAALGLGAELWHWLGSAHGDAAERAVAMLSLSYESNLPTWYSTCLLFSCAVACALAGTGWHWRGLAIGFAYMSLDEAIELHEKLGGTFATGGVLYFDWVIPAALVVAVVAALYVPFLRTLPADVRHRFLLAGALYVGGAVIMELPLGYWTERAGSENLTYAIIDFFEESLEIAGASLFLLSVWRYRQRTP